MKIKRLLTCAIALIISISAFGGCNKVDGVDKNKSQLNIGIFKAGLGTKWLEEAMADFTEYYAETSFEEGKKGVQLIMDDRTEEFKVTNLSTTMPYNDNAIYFLDQADFETFHSKGLLEDITETVKEKVYDEDGNFAKDTGKDATLSIIDRMNDEFIGYHERNGSYYALPYRLIVSGMMYDADLFDKNIFTFPETWTCYNTSLAKGKDCYVMAIEIGKPEEIAGVPFTIVFAKSKDLKTWELLDPTKYVHTKDRYSACPVIRYSNGYYYMIYLEEFPLYKFCPYIARSVDLLCWEIAPVNPVLFYGDEDRVLAGDFSEEEIERINTSLNTNNSDVDLCEFNGKTIILYSWGNQMGREFLAQAEYDGPLSEFFESFF